MRNRLVPKWMTLTGDLRIVFFSFESNLESNRPSDSFSNRIFESNRPYTTQAVFSVLFNYYFTVFHPYKYETAQTTVVYTLHLQRIFHPSIGILYLWRTRVMYGLWNSYRSTCLFQFSYKTRQTMLLYAYFTRKVDFKRKFNHHQSFLYEWRLTARTIFSNRPINTNRISNRTYDSKSNRITKLRRSLLETPYRYVRSLWPQQPFIRHWPCSYKDTILCQHTFPTPNDSPLIVIFFSLRKVKAVIAPA